MQKTKVYVSFLFFRKITIMSITVYNMATCVVMFMDVLWNFRHFFFFPFKSQ